MSTRETRPMILLHTAVFLAGWTGILGRVISLDGLPLVWYRMMVSVVVLALVLALMGRLHRTGWAGIAMIAGCGAILAVHWVAFYASIQASNVSIGVACIATSCFFTTVLDPLVNRKRMSWVEVFISFIAILGVLLIFSLDVRYRLGIGLGLLSAALYSLFSIVNINVARKTGEDSATMLLYELIGGVLFRANYGGHSEILDTFAQYGVWGGIPVLYIIFYTPYSFKKRSASKTVLAVSNAHYLAIALFALFDPFVFQVYFPLLILCPIMYSDIMKWAGELNEHSVDS